MHFDDENEPVRWHVSKLISRVELPIGVLTPTNDGRKQEHETGGRDWRFGMTATSKVHIMEHFDTVHTWRYV